MNRRAFLGSLAAIPAGIRAALVPRTSIAAPVTPNTICFPVPVCLPVLYPPGCLYIPHMRGALILSNPNDYCFSFGWEVSIDGGLYIVEVSQGSKKESLWLTEDAYLELGRILRGPDCDSLPRGKYRG